MALTHSYGCGVAITATDAYIPIRTVRSSLVISQGASRLPRTGFFECVERLGRFCGPSDGVAAASWHASEVVRVFEYDYPESAEA